MPDKFIPCAVLDVEAMLVNVHAQAPLVRLRAPPVPLNAIWPDETEREFTYIYSACGCPVKALVRRIGDRTIRAKELPVMFPDDPAVLEVIGRLMRWN